MNCKKLFAITLTIATLALPSAGHAVSCLVATSAVISAGAACFTSYQYLPAIPNSTAGCYQFILVPTDDTQTPTIDPAKFCRYLAPPAPVGSVLANCPC